MSSGPDVAEGPAPAEDQRIFKGLGSIASALRKKATDLDLAYTNLTELPPEVCEITSLKSLGLQGNRLETLPPEIANLSRLEYLRLDRNLLSSLPDEVAALKQLRHLDLSGRQQLRALPPAVCELGSLRELYLVGNAYPTLPPDIGRLQSLETLSLAHGAVEVLPPTVGRLASLQLLDLRHSQVRDLPRELADRLKAGLQLQIVGTRLPEPYGDLAARGSTAIATYLASLEDAFPTYEAKVLLVGEGNVGKSSLVAALLEEPFVSGRPTTHGIEIHQMVVSRPDLPSPLTLRAWDFGGQEVYRVTHQFFFSDRALYLVVWNPREGAEQNEVEGWLHRIRLRVGAKAPTLIVATHCDERRPELNYPQLAEDFPDMLRGNLAVDNRTGSGIDALRRAITVEAALLPQMGQRLSGRWIAARDEILALGTDRPQIAYTDFTRVCGTHGMDDRETSTLAELLHDLGQVIYYSGDEGLRDIVVLNPEWLTKAIGYVLEDTVTREADGVLDHARLKEIWQQDDPEKQSYTPEHHPYFLRLMEKFDVSYRLDEDQQRRSLVAQLAPHDRPDLPWTQLSPVPDDMRSLSLVCDLTEPAPGLIAWLTVRHHRASVGRHWRTGVFLRHPIETYKSEALIELRNDRQLLVDVRAPSPDLFFNVVRDSIEELIRSRWPGLDYRLSVPCPTRTAGGRPCGGRFRLDALLRYRQKGGTVFPCQECVQEHDVAALLTGFGSTGVTRDEEFDQLQHQLQDVADGVNRIEVFAADSADSMRRVLKAIATEVVDCPRLFSIRIARKTLLSWVRLGQLTFRLTLWCEHPGEWHPTEGSYDYQADRRWWAGVKPYAAIVFKALRLVSAVAGTVVDTGLATGRLAVASEEIKAMGDLIGQVPAPAGDSDALGASAAGQLTMVEGESLRAFRRMLFTVDPPQAFGGLRRVHSAAGDLLWVCGEHYRLYDPGLPDLADRPAPAPPRQRTPGTQAAEHVFHD